MSAIKDKARRGDLAVYPVRLQNVHLRRGVQTSSNYDVGIVVKTKRDGQVHFVAPLYSFDSIAEKKPYPKVDPFSFTSNVLLVPQTMVDVEGFANKYAFIRFADLDSVKSALQAFRK